MLTFLETLVSGTFPFFLLVICGGFFTVKAKFFQFRNFKKSIKLFFKSEEKNEKTSGFSMFQSLCTSLSATLGTGNIAGVAGAISLGGAGAVFWMWITSILGTCVKSVEIFLAIKYRQKESQSYVGGPMYYIKNALPKVFMPLGFVFSIVGIIAAFFNGNVTQINAVAVAMPNSILMKFLVGIVFAIITAAVLIGGAKRIGKFTEKAVPLMAGIYIVLCLGVIFVNFQYLPKVFKMIFVGAFKPKAVTAGAVSSFATTVFTGASRGVFSNEAGLGTSAMAHSATDNANEKTQGLFGIFEVFVDTILLCTLTALTILCSKVKIEYGSISSSELVGSSFNTLYGKFSQPILVVLLGFLAITSIIGWAFYGIICTKYIFGKEKVFIYLYPLGCVIGVFCNVQMVWRIAAICTGVMLCINVIAIIILQNNALEFLKE